MKTLHITVTNKVATYQRRDGGIVCNNGDYQVQFVFDDEWEGVEKMARFLWNGKYKDVAVDADGIAKVPPMHGADNCYVGVYSTNNETLRATTPAIIPCEPSVFCYGGISAGESDPRPEDPRIVETFALLASDWVSTDAEDTYSQRVWPENVTDHSKVDLLPSPEQVTDLFEQGIALIAVNDGGRVTVFAIGGLPENDYEMQALITEVEA